MRRRYEAKTTVRQLILKAPTEDELNKNFEKMALTRDENEEKPGSAGSKTGSMNKDSEKKKEVKSVHQYFRKKTLQKF